jgi:hypothetical protein
MNIRPAESDVKKFLRVALRQRARAVVSLEVKTRAAGLLSEDQHITDARVFKRAKKSLGIKSMRAGFGARSHWLWQLPRLNQEAQEEDATPQPRLPIDWVEGVARLEPDRPPSGPPPGCPANRAAAQRTCKWRCEASDVARIGVSPGRQLNN